MALTFSPVDGAELNHFGKVTATTFDVTLDTDYPTGGWPINARSVGLGAIIFGAYVIAHRGAAGAATTGYLFLFDAVASKLQSFDGAAANAPLNETTAGDNDLDGRVVRVMFIGV
jgi:hypothetical protein